MKELASTILFGLEMLLKHAPGIYQGIAAVVAKKNVTADDLRAKRAEIAGDTYEKIVTNTKLSR